MAALTFKAIVDAVLADAFAESKREAAKTWVAGRHAWWWDAEEWTFKQASDTITFTANSYVAAAPTDVHAVFAIYDQDGSPLEGIPDLRRFYSRYNANLGGGSSTPEAYTLVNGQIIVGPSGDGSSGLIVYEKAKPSLVDDTDMTGFPDGYDLGLVHGGKAEGFKLTNIQLAASLDQDFTAFVNAMRNNWLDQVKETGGQMPAWR